MSISLYSGPLNPVDEDVVDKAKSFANEHLKPYAEQWEQTRQQPEKTLRMAISQFAGIRIPKELGGSGSSTATIARVYEELAKIDIGFTCALAVHNIVTIAAAFIENESLRDRYLDKLMSGEAIGAFLLTEPDIGSDATSIQTLAIEKNDKYIINKWCKCRPFSRFRSDRTGIVGKGNRRFCDQIGSAGCFGKTCLPHAGESCHGR
jgi:hypothetical protein